MQTAPTVLALLTALSLPAPAEEKARSGISVRDTGRAGGTWLQSGETPTVFEGDAVVTNGRISIVAAKGSSAVEVRGGTVPRARLELVDPDGSPLARLARVALVENSRSAATLELAGETETGSALAARLRIKRGEVSVEVQPIEGRGWLRVGCPSRFVVLPDFFADDIVIDARTTRADSVEIPSENFLLQLAGEGEAIAMTVFEDKDRDVRLSLSGEREARIAVAAEIELGTERKVWVSVLEAPGIWTATEVGDADAGKIRALGWSMPFRAAWRCDFTRVSQAFGMSFVDSFDMLLQKEPGGKYAKPSWLGGGDDAIEPDRQRWNTFLGTFSYPAWSDPEARGFIQPIEHAAHRGGPFRGAVVLYPINRVVGTPRDTFTVVDVVRNVLGTGPCEYLLDVEGKKSQYKGRATCSARDVLTEIYRGRRQKEERPRIETVLDEAMTFVRHIRGRIATYVEFGKQTQTFLTEQVEAHPECKEPIEQLLTIAREIDARYAAREEKIRTPDHVAAMNEEFRRSVLDDEGPEALGRCKEYAAALVDIGGSQDELAGECRWVVRLLRQKAGLLVAEDPRLASVAEEIRTRTQQVLRNAAVHESAGH